MKRLLLSILIAAALWFIMFSPLTAGLLNFWLAMTCSAFVLAAIAWKASRGKIFLGEVSKILLSGILIAAVLWVLFWIGDKVSQSLFSFARPEVDSIYAMKEGENPWILSLLLLCIIGPAEELFWRGYVQRTLSTRWGANAGYAAATLAYTLVHVPSLNLMLLLSALVCGIVWGGLFRLMPRRFPSILLSHALWDAAVFVWFPIS